MTAGEKASVIAAAKTAIDNAIAAQFAHRTIDAETRAFLTTGGSAPSGLATTSLKAVVEAELGTTITVNE